MRGSPGSLGQGVPHHQTLLHLPELAKVFAQTFCNHTAAFGPVRAPRPSPLPRPLPPVTPAQPGRPRAKQRPRSPLPPLPSPHPPPVEPPGAHGGSRKLRAKLGWRGTAPAGFPPLGEPPHKSLSRRCERSWLCRRRVPGAQPTPRCPLNPSISSPPLSGPCALADRPAFSGYPGGARKRARGRPGSAGRRAWLGCPVPGRRGSGVHCRAGGRSRARSPCVVCQLSPPMNILLREEERHKGPA